MTRSTNPSRRSVLAGAAAAAGATLFAPAVLRAQSKEVNLYSSRHYNTDERLYSDFTARTGIAVNRVEANADQLIERLKSEGAASPADVFISVDAGRLEKLNGEGLFQPVQSAVLSGAVPEALRDPDGHWFGFSSRARVIMYHRDRVTPDQLSTYENLVDERWRGKLLTRSSGNIYSQSLTGSILAALGPEKTEAWARGLVANFARAPQGGDTDQIKAVAAGLGDICISNTYYLGNIIAANKEEDRPLIEKMAVFFPNQGDRGTHINISGGGVLANSKNRDNAVAFLEYLISPEAQGYFSAGNNEYPVLADVPPPPAIAPFGTFKADQLNARVFARNNAEALKIMDRAGWA